jgi:hypothetical protein
MHLDLSTWMVHYAAECCLGWFLLRSVHIRIVSIQGSPGENNDNTDMPHTFSLPTQQLLHDQRISRFMGADFDNPSDQSLISKLRGQFDVKGLRMLLLD